MKNLLLVFSLFISFLSYSQGETDQQLAQYYYGNGEFDKALGYYEKIFGKDQNGFNFNRYYECLLKTNHQKEAEKLLKKQISSQPENIELVVLLAEFYEQTEENQKADKIYEDAKKEFTKEKEKKYINDVEKIDI